VIASEDERFFHHLGVDLWAIMRAAWRDLTGHYSLQGGSRITQQLVKQYYVGSKRSLWRKLREAILAVRLERRYSKNQILEQYLNRISLGQGAYGVEAAAQTYFNRPVGKLTLAQAALLAGIAPAPSVYDPRKHPALARARRDYVLGRMAANRFITDAEAAAARLEPVKLAPSRPPITKDPYFVDYVRRYVAASYGDDQLYRGGLQIETTLDPAMQDAAERAISGILNQPGDPAAALVAIDVHTGAIRALVGGRDFRKSPFNLATQGRRQAGSAFKPFVLATALAKGISPYHYYDAPGTLDLHGWNVSTYDRGGYGYINIVTGTVYSVNTLYAQLILDVGPTSVATTAHRMGIQSHLEADPTLTLGTSAVSPLEMASAYATFASGGIYHRPTAVQWIKDAGGDVLQSLGRPAGKHVLKRSVAEETTAILQKVVRSGTGTAAALSDYVVAGKTGTTDDHADAWFCGYTADIAACVWVGRPTARIPMESVHGISVTGGSFPAEIWHAFMSEVPTPAEALAVASISGSLVVLRLLLVLGDLRPRPGRRGGRWEAPTRPGGHARAAAVALAAGPDLPAQLRVTRPR